MTDLGRTILLNLSLQRQNPSSKKRRSDLRNGLTDKQTLFLFGKLSGLNE
jgi:hypothetical protein